MVPFRLTVFGPPELHAPNGDPVRFRTRKHLALLIYLAIEPPGVHRREKLASLLWSRAEKEEARHSLATGLSLLRGRLGGESFDTTRETIRLMPGVIVSEVQSLERDDPAANDGSALGGFLEDFDVDDALEFQQWKDMQSARLFPLLHSTLTQRIDYVRRRGDSRRMEALAHQLLRIDDLSEDAARAQLEARAMAGDRIGALRMFDRWRSRLAEELGAVPSPALSRMADRLRLNGAIAMPDNLALSPSKESREDRAFLGRGAEFSACYDVWERARRGDASHVLVHGDPGIGKTTLVARFAASVALEGASLARVKCYDLERELPYGAIGGFVGQLLELPGASATPPEHLAEVGRLVPKVRQRYPSLPSPASSIGESSRMLFTEGVMALVSAICDERPLMVVVEDIHLADSTSLAILHFLLRRILQAPLMMVLTSSPELRGDGLDRRQFTENADSFAIMQLHLGPLQDDDAAALLDSLLTYDLAPSAALRRSILSGCRGNPMILELLVHDWRKRGNGCLAFSLGAMTACTAAPAEEAFRRVVDHTLMDLDADARAVAELAAILGQRLSDVSLYRLIGLPVARTMRAMTSLAAQRILRDGGTTLEFTNDFVRGQCYMAMAIPLRRMLHGAVADRLLAQDGANDPIPGLEIAWHLVRADRLHEAVPYLLAGGAEAIRRAAPHEADLALSTGLPALDGDAKRTAILLLVEALQELGRWADSLQLLDISNEPFTRAEHSCRNVFRSIAQRWLGLLSIDEMRTTTDDLLNIAISDVAVEIRVKALTASVRLLGMTRNEGQLTTLQEVVPVVALSEMDEYQQLHIILARAWTLAIRHRPSDALAEIRRGVRIAESAAIASSIAVRLLVGEGNLLSMAGQYTEALAPLSRAERMAARLDNRTLQAECASQLAMVEGRLGRSANAIAWARQALRDFAPTEWSANSLGATYELGLNLVADGRATEAQSVVSILSRLHENNAPHWMVQAGLLFGADVVGLSGNSRRAFALAKRATSGSFSRLMNVAYAGQFARWVALLGVRSNDVMRARTRLRSEFDTTGHLDSKDQVEVLASLALLDSTAGEASIDGIQEIKRRLATLPESVRIVMRRLGVYSE